MTFNALSRVGAFVVVVSLITTISSCEKYVDDGPCYFEGCLDCCADNPHKEFINWYFYDVGSYHIYENQLTGQVDTVLVTDFHAGYNHWGTFAFFSLAEVINRDITVIIDYDERLTHPSYSHPKLETMVAGYLSFDQNTGRGSSNYALLFPLFVGHKSFPPNYQSKTEIIAIHPQLTIGGLDFENVVEIDVINDASENDHHTRYFVVKHVGVVRIMDLDTGDDWQLTEYAVFQ